MFIGRSIGWAMSRAMLYGRPHAITRSTAIHRVCYAEAKQYMVLWFKRRDGVDSAPYHFCALGPDVFKEFMAADSMGRFYNEHIGGTRNKHGPFDCRDHPIPTF